MGGFQLLKVLDVKFGEAKAKAKASFYKEVVWFKGSKKGKVYTSVPVRDTPYQYWYNTTLFYCFFDTTLFIVLDLVAIKYKNGKERKQGYAAAETNEGRFCGAE